MGSLGDREFQSYRLVRKGKTATDEDGTPKWSQYALGVVGEDGSSLNPTDLLGFLLVEQRLTNKLLGLLLQQLGGFYAEDGLSNTG